MPRPIVFCVPIFLHADHLLPFNKCEIIEGVVVEKMTPALRSVLAGACEVSTPGSGPAIPTSHAILVDCRRYARALTDRLQAQGADVKEVRDLLAPDSRDGLPPFLPFEIARQVLVSLVISGMPQFSVSGFYTLELTSAEGDGGYECHGYTHLSPEEVPFATASALGTGKTSPVNEAQLIDTMRRLDRYYRLVYWQVDRMSIALNSLWSGLCSRYGDQSFLSMFTVIEALVSTENEGVTHQLAERVAVLLGSGRDDRYDRYDQFRKLYKVRSSLVHGSSFVKKDSSASIVLFLSAKRSIIPMAQLNEVARLAISLIATILQDDELMSIIQSQGPGGQAKDRTDQLLREQYMKRLFA